MCRPLHLELSLVALLGLLLWSHSAQADAPQVEPFSPEYTGAFVALGAFGGPTWSSTPLGAGGGWASSFGVWSQFTSPLQVIDAQLAYQHSDAHLKLPGGQDAALRQDSLSMCAGLHPMFITHLQSSTLDMILGGAYLLVGLDLERIQASLPEGEVTDWDPGFQLGAGIDAPLDDIHNGSSLWVGLQYRYNFIDLERRPAQTLDVRQHMLYLRLSWRRNGFLTDVPGSAWP